MVILYLAACAFHQPPVLFPTPLPEVEPPVSVAIRSSADECDDAAAYKPGSPPPFVVDELVTCRAQVVPESQVLELLHASDLATYWGDVGPACYERSAADRSLAQRELDVVWLHQKAAEADARALRVAMPVAFVGGVVIGLGAGAAYAKINGAL